VLAAEGYEFERTCCVPGGEGEWSERVVVVRSPMHANQQAAGLETRLSHAETHLTALTPPRGRGKRQITDEATLVEAIDLVLTAHRVDGLLSVAWEKQVEQMFVKLNEQIEGLTYLLTLGVRVLTVMVLVLRRSLENDQARRPDVHPENKQKMSDTPTAERILKAFADISLTIIKNAAGEDILRRLTSLSGLQEDILQRLGLGAALYGQLEIQAIGN
jgi:transposase